MPSYRVPLVNGEYYHIFNRGVAKNPIFFSKSDYEQAMLTLSYYPYSNLPMKLSRFKELAIDERLRLFSGIQTDTKLVEIISFVFMPNHFHLLLKQTAENGISIFLSLLTNSYTRYINTKYDRVGPLFQGVFKAVHIDSEDLLLHISRYIHLNPVTSFVIPEKDLLAYYWSSYPLYFNEQKSIVNTQTILKHFSSKEDYARFVSDQISYAKELENIKHLILE